MDVALIDTIDDGRRREALGRLDQRGLDVPAGTAEPDEAHALGIDQPFGIERIDYGKISSDVIGRLAE